MRLPFLVVALSLSAFTGVLPCHAQNAFTPDQVKWGPAPRLFPLERNSPSWKGTRWQRPATSRFA